MYEGEGLGRLIIDLDAVLGEAAVEVTYGFDSGSFNDNMRAYAIGKALITLYPERTQQMLDRIDMLLKLTEEPEGE